MRKVLIGLAAVMVFLTGAVGAGLAEELVVYTSMKASLMEKLKEDFERAHPGVALNYESAGAGKIMARLLAEREQGQNLADVLWTSEVPDFYALKDNGLLEPYTPKDIKMAINPFPDYDGSFTAVRLGTLGIAYNTDLIKVPPASWHDLAGPAYKNAFGMADPALSGTAYMSLALLVSKFGWEYFEQLSINGLRTIPDSKQVIADVAEGKLTACLAVDYIARDLMAKGAPLNLVYPPQMLVVPSPVAVLKNGPNPGPARAFVDYLLSKDAQGIIAGEGTLPVRPDVRLPERYDLPLPISAMQRAIPINYARLKSSKADTLVKYKRITNLPTPLP